MVNIHQIQTQTSKCRKYLSSLINLICTIAHTAIETHQPMLFHQKDTQPNQSIYVSHSDHFILLWNKKVGLLILMEIITENQLDKYHNSVFKTKWNKTAFCEFSLELFVYFLFSVFSKHILVSFCRGVIKMLSHTYMKFFEIHSISWPTLALRAR